MLSAKATAMCVLFTVSGQSPRLRWSYVLTGAHANVTAMFVDQVATVVCWLVAV